MYASKENQAGNILCTQTHCDTAVLFTHTQEKKKKEAY